MLHRECTQIVGGKGRRSLLQEADLALGLLVTVHITRMIEDARQVQVIEEETGEPRREQGHQVTKDYLLARDMAGELENQI